MKRRIAGEGSVFQLPDGRWAADLPAGRGPFGRRKRVRVSAKSPSVLRERMLAKQRDLAEGRKPAAKASVAAWLEKEWLPVVRERKRAATALDYARSVKNYLVPKLGKATFAQLEPRDFEAWYAELRRKRVGPRTISKIHATMRAALNYAVRTGVTPRNVLAMIEPPRYEPKPRRRYTAEQVAAFLTAARGTPGEALFILALFGQLRSGELLALRWDDLDLDARTVTVARTMTDDAKGKPVVGTTTKTRAGLRTIALPHLVVDALARHERTGEYVFVGARGKQVRRQNVGRRWLRPLQEKAGLPTITFHELRHTGASLLRELGGDLVALRDRLGHESITTTADVYVHLDLSAQRKLSDTLDAAFPTCAHEAGAQAEIVAEVDSSSDLVTA